MCPPCTSGQGGPEFQELVQTLLVSIMLGPAGGCNLFVTNSYSITDGEMYFPSTTACSFLSNAAPLRAFLGLPISAFRLPCMLRPSSIPTDVSSGRWSSMVQSFP